MTVCSPGTGGDATENSAGFGGGLGALGSLAASTTRGDTITIDVGLGGTCSSVNSSYNDIVLQRVDGPSVEDGDEISRTCVSTVCLHRCSVE